MTSAALTRFDLHRQKAAALPDVSGQLPRILSRAMERLPKLFSRRGPTWKVKTLDGNAAAAALRYHHKGIDETRKARDQRYHTDIEVLKFLLSRLNVNPHHDGLNWLQIRWTRIDDIVEATQFARSTVCESLRRLKQAGILRTKRRKNEAKDREWIAMRWMTSALFDMLGLLSWLKKQKEGSWQKKKAKAEDMAGEGTNAAPRTPSEGLQAIKDIIGMNRRRPPGNSAGGRKN